MINPRSSRYLRTIPFIPRGLSSISPFPPLPPHQFLHFISHPTIPQNPNSVSFPSLGSWFHDYVNLSDNLYPSFGFSSVNHLRHFTTNATFEDAENGNLTDQDDTNEEVEPIDLWEEEEEAEPEIGDGGDGGGVVLQKCPWGERVLSIARDVLQQFGDDIEIFAFKTSPRGYIYVRLDRVCNEYGCPSLEDIQSYSHEYKKRLDEAGAVGEIPNDLALEVSSPGADRLLRIPEDLQRFKDMAMRVRYIEQEDEKEGVFFLESIKAEEEGGTGMCVFRLADVKENRDPSSKGRPMSRKQKDWRLKLPYQMLKQILLI